MLGVACARWSSGAAVATLFAIVAARRARRLWMPANTSGTKKSVETVANSSPPMTARPSGAFCSAPSPRPSAIGIMPMIIANAVIRTGRMRLAPASSAAVSGGAPAESRWRANDNHQNAVRGGDAHRHDRAS